MKDGFLPVFFFATISTMQEIPTTEPTEFISGDTVKWTRAVDGFLASDGWSLKYVFNFQSSVEATKKTVTASASGDDFSVTIAASASGAYTAGDYFWTAYVEKGSERYTVDSGRLKVKPDPVNVAAGVDLRSNAKVILDAIDATLANTATSDQKNILVNGKMIQRYGLDEMWKLRCRFAAEVRREEDAEKLANGLATGRKVVTRFI